MSKEVCSMCGGKMVKGVMVDYTYGPLDKKRQIWAEEVSGSGLFAENQYNVDSFRCQECGFLENYATRL